VIRAALVAVLAGCGAGSAFVPPMESHDRRGRPDRGGDQALLPVTAGDGDGCLDGRPLHGGDRVLLPVIDGRGARDRYVVAAAGGIIERVEAVPDWPPMLAVPWSVSLGDGVAHVVTEHGDLRARIPARPPTWRSAAGVACTGGTAATWQVFVGGDVVVVEIEHAVTDLCSRDAAGNGYAPRRCTLLVAPLQ